MVSIPLTKSVISVSLRRICVEEYFSHISLKLFIWRALDQVLEKSCPFGADFFRWSSEWRFPILPCKFASSMELWESSPWILSGYLSFRAWVIYCLSRPFRCCIPVLHHAMCIMTAPSHKHELTNAFNLERECSYLTPPWMFLRATLEVLHALLAIWWHVFMSFILGDYTWPNCSLVSSPLLNHEP
jgi:hypothetical protein